MTTLTPLCWINKNTINNVLYICCDPIGCKSTNVGSISSNNDNSFRMCCDGDELCFNYLVKKTEKPTGAPITKAPTTQAPITEAPTTEAPITEGPSNKTPITEAPLNATSFQGPKAKSCF